MANVLVNLLNLLKGILNLISLEIVTGLYLNQF